ncbi:MAG: hypothetical protein GY757_55860 [bacterium]|nr:hypothetical protein [bacterium]
MIKKRVMFLIMFCFLVVGPMLLPVSGYQSSSVSVAITSPIAGAGVGQNIKVEATVGNAYLVRFYADNVYKGKAFTDSYGKVTYTISTSGWSEGSYHAIKAIAWGEEYESATHIVTVRRHRGAVTYDDFKLSFADARVYLDYLDVPLNTLKIAVIDYDFDYETAYSLASAVDFVYDAVTFSDQTGVTNWGTVDLDDIFPGDCHGNTVASIVYSLIPEASYTIIKTDGSSASIVDAIDYARLVDPSIGKEKADVIIMSIYNPNGYSSQIDYAVGRAFNDNIFVACAAGERNLSYADQPASSRYAYSVGASDIWGFEEWNNNGSYNSGIYNFSMFGYGNGWDTLLDDGERDATVNSWCAPQAAAVAALIKAKYQYSAPTMSPRTIAAKMNAGLNTSIGDYVIDPYISVQQ